MKLDILAIGAHPDYVEISAAGTIISQVKQGLKVGILELTRGELGTRVTPEIRDKECINAANIMGVCTRGNARFRDGFILNNEEHQIELIKHIRAHQPNIILCNAECDSHPDHTNTGQLVKDASFLSGLRKIKTQLNGSSQEPWRPKSIYFYIQYVYIKPDIVIDISPFQQEKMAAIKAHKSQFFDPKSNEPETLISQRSFLDKIVARDQEFGRCINTDFAEGFTTARTIGTSSLTQLL